MNANKLKMNAEKTKYIVVRSVRKELRSNITLKYLDGSEIKRVEIIKYFSIIMMINFDFKTIVMLKKINKKKTSFLNRIGNFISIYTRCIIYKKIVASHFEYCVTLLIDMGETQLNKLQKTQNRAMRTILQCDRYTKVEDMLQTLQFMSIKDYIVMYVFLFLKF